MKKLLIIAGAILSLSAKEIILTSKQLNELGITTAPLSATTALSQSNLPATVVIPPRQLSIAASMHEGVVHKVFVGVGDSVKAGQTVATVSSTEGLTLQREYLQTATRLERLQALVKKDETLFKEGIISEREYLKSKQEVSLLSAELAEKKASMKMMGVSPSKTGVMNMTGAIKAPASGIILEQTALLGQKVDAMSPIYKIADLSTLWLEIQAPSSITKKLNLGDTIQTNLGATAKIIKISSGVELQNQSVIIRAVVLSGRELLRPGQFVQASIQTPATQSIVVPKNGIIRNKGKSVIFVKTARGFHPVEVTIVKEECSTFIITGALKGNEQVAVRGMVPLKGMWLENGDDSK
ncbi:MAG: efflux RND transporter periplasmic adaptor subunit [Sulfuricurvum sp.]|jgi:cobalt-zinc-cadmium efflux system membrane fusion protein|uniref:efflux RND transporter periplasmic adaptor subunit n=1 Tax=Sulfuricurvum sp. TaxID=2025608 RepID=UPI0025D10913|nr:efflux RND transporter periplasmic adaptor subunit [Sulfuricurvum sp.]MCK9374434.1 efflux RND transporter periplasmic adaptor subunit [Sulfuricurvum sp.]